jgi:DNA-binding beta-propeller fold protein YncE
VDPSGGSVTNIYVADWEAGTVIQMGKTSGGWTLTAIATTPANTMQLPSHVAIDPVTGDLFVTDAILPTAGNPVAGAFWRISRGTFQIQSISSGGFFEQPRGLGVRH